jgi:hypothetical protein
LDLLVPVFVAPAAPGVAFFAAAFVAAFFAAAFFVGIVLRPEPAGLSPAAEEADQFGDGN